MLDHLVVTLPQFRALEELVMFCSQCGAQAESGARFCGVCGKKMAASAPAPAVVVPPVVTAAPVKRGISIWLKVILGGAGADAAIFLPHTPQKRAPLSACAPH